jgi:hypothetical protein
MPTIHIPDATYHHLADHASARHITVDDLAAEWLDRFTRDPAPLCGVPDVGPVTAAAWVADLRRWVGTLPDHPLTIDDSRDSIYGD